MPLKNNDTLTIERVREKLQAAFRANDSEQLQQATDDLVLWAAQETVKAKEAYDRELEQLRGEMDSGILAARGVRQLTSEERSYWQKFQTAALSPDPRQAVTGLSDVLPKTTIDSVFEELQTRHPLLSRIRFVYTGGAVEVMVNTNGYGQAQWGDLCAEIVAEATAGVKKVKTSLLKLSAFMSVCKAMLELGPEWIDSFVRQTLYEYFSNGMEAGIVTGDGNGKPIGMIRQGGDNVTVTGGVYPEKPAVVLTDLSPATVGNLVSLLAADPNGKPRQVRDLIFLVNPQDYFQKVMPATTLQAPDGTYRNDVLPYPMEVIQVAALPRGKAVLGIAYRYLAMAGTSPEGRIEYSDHYHFLEDERVYLIKGYANGEPLDNNAFLVLDISGLKPAAWRVTMVEEAAPSSNAALAALSLGSLTLSPAFDGAVTAYTAATGNASNTITAVPADAGASVQVLVGDKEIDNGTAPTWAAGSNTVTVNVPAADGTAKKAYTVTVTKS